LSGSARSTRGEHSLPTGSDPITFSVILNRFNRIVTEMTITLERSAWTPILALCKDFSCAIFDASGRLVAMHDALPVQSISLPLVLRDINETFGDRIYEGDVFACNDPFRFNTHIGDFITATPVFVDGEHRFWVATKGHQIDTGAYLPASVVPAAENVWQEGIGIPPVKFYERGEERFDVVELYLRNVRYRELAYGDLLAQLGSIWTGAERLGDLCEEWGIDLVLENVEAMIEYADHRMSEAMSEIPNGSYEAEGWVDSDGIDTFDIPVKVKVDIEGDKVNVDFTGSGPQGAGGLNGTFATAQAAGAIPFLQYIDPEIPHNDGCLGHIDVHAPEGSVCNASFPASTSAATIVPTDMMMDVIHMAMAQAVPHLVAAGSARCQIVPQFSGVDERNGEDWGVMLFNNSGGQGGNEAVDGWPLWESTSASGGLKIQSVEQLELLYPIRVGELEVEPDSMGFGKSLGGPGTRLAIEPIQGPIECITFGDSFANPPHGVLGGTPGSGGGQYVEAADGSRRYFSVSGRVVVEPGEKWVGISTGGGGYGSPLERDTARVLADVRTGFVSRDAARDVFGTVIVEKDGELGVDEEQTVALRTELGAVERPMVEPTGPSSSEWLNERMRPEDQFLVNPI
jgi:N-methylhydantoinase B